MKAFRITISILVLVTVLTGVNNYSYAEGEPPFNNLRFEEDWSKFKPGDDPSMLEKLKKIELSDNVWVSFGGEFRARLEAWDGFGFSDSNDDEYVLFRTHLHGDVHIGDNWRVFLEGRFNTLTDRDLPGGRRDALDADYGDIWNTFVEYTTTGSNVKTTVRVGRQELQYGKQRLVSPLDWANNRRIFDGAVVKLAGVNSPWKVDAFVTVPVMEDRNSFNDSNEDVVFGGVYFTRAFPEQSLNMDAYFLALDSSMGVYDNERYTVGGRLWGKVPSIENLSFEIEGAYQFGDHMDMDISAWMFTAEATYTFADAPHKPWVTLGFDYASGDDDPTDGDTETFSHLFPLAHAYLGFADVIGRQNVMDYRATFGCWPIEKKLRLRSDVHYLMLADDNDGLYSVGGGLVRGPMTEDEVGTEVDFTLLYKCNKHTDLLVGYSHVFAGDFIEETGPDDDIDFFYSQVGFTF
jgi:hypothetical protein